MLFGKMKKEPSTGRICLPYRTSGIALRVLNLDKKTDFFYGETCLKVLANQQVIVIAHMNQQMVYRAIVNLKDNNMSGGNIPTAATADRYFPDNHF